MAEEKEGSIFGEWIKKGFLLYKNNFLVLFVATVLAWALSVFIAGLITGPMAVGIVLSQDSVIAQVLVAYVASVVGVVSFAVLGGPLFAGLSKLTLRCLDGNKPKAGIGDLFKGFQYFASAFLFVAAWGIINIVLQGLAPLILSPVLLPVVPMVVSIITGTLSMFGLFLIVDKGKTFLQAFQESIKVARKRFWLYAAIVLVAGAISVLGMLACGVGVFLTAPMNICIMAAVYRDAVKPSA